MKNRISEFHPWEYAPFFQLDGIPIIEQLKSNWRELAEEYERFKHFQLPYGLDIYTGNWLVGAFRTHPNELDVMDIGVKRAAVGSWFSRGGADVSDEEIDLTYRKLWDMRLKRNRSCCPLLSSLLEPLYPHSCLTYVYSTMEPGVQIAPHRGANASCIRVHLCLKQAEDCWLTVRGDRRTWKSGEAWAFDDSSLHSAEHHGATERVILMVDFSKEFVEHELRQLVCGVRPSG